MLVFLYTNISLRYEVIGKKNQEDADGQIKGLLTDGNLQVESKGKDPIEIISYHRFIGSTNNEDPTNVRKGNRRKWIIRCSDELKNNKEKFNRLYKLIDDDIQHYNRTLGNDKSTF